MYDSIAQFDEGYTDDYHTHDEYDSIKEECDCSNCMECFGMTNSDFF